MKIGRAIDRKIKVKCNNDYNPEEDNKVRAHEYEIKTERLLLRPMTVEDADAVWKWVSDEHVARYMVYPTYTDKEKLVDWLRSIEVFDGEYHFGFVRLSDGELIGSGSIGPHKKEGFWGFGYNLRHDCWGMGENEEWFAVYFN